MDLMPSLSMLRGKQEKSYSAVQAYTVQPAREGEIVAKERG